ncbi:hypothetical protein LX16_4246 [Stackebrandtia albiflava]|uniref:SWIM-type domain-containing protein n=1 Tax=Stackebrandtia albiflava TaxID=406432 RepID=A0A562UYY5_9ACTN|nr:hypothetical protein [Stackebrandtia albiflava]TWJ10822.1 hypothetical protein LX16_4246 [Stackebrandtia albiflava]
MKPSIAPDLLSGLLSDAPARVRKRLDADPAKADTWQWNDTGDGVTVDTGSETVRLSAGPLTTADQVGCSCLLSPRCLHLLAVVGSLPLTEAAETTGEDETATAAAPEPAAVVTLTPEQRAAAALAWQTGVELADTGLAAAGTALKASLLRAVHACRVAGLHRVAAAGAALSKSVTDLAHDHPHFSLPTAAAQLAELLDTAWRLCHTDAVDAAVIGVARRGYQPADPMRLHGVCAVPVASHTGYGGVVTVLADARRGLVTVSDVMPDGVPATAYRGAVSIGGLSVSHRDLAGGVLYLQDATATTTGRLGGGKARASVTGTSDWDAEPLADLWRTPLPAQLDRAFTAFSLPAEDRPEAADLLFLDATVHMGSSGPALVTDEGTAMTAVADNTDPRVQFTQNLRRLGAMQGHRLRLVARLLPGRSRRVAPLAVRLDGRVVHLGFEDLPGVRPVDLPGSAVDDTGSPIEPMRLILQRIAMGGRDCAGTVAAASTRRAAARLRQRFMPHAAGVLDNLTRCAQAVEQDMFGRTRPTDRPGFATAWAAAHGYQSAADLALSRATWQDATPD